MCLVKSLKVTKTKPNLHHAQEFYSSMNNLILGGARSEKWETDHCKKKKVKLSPLRISHCLDNRLTDGKVVSPTHRPLLYSPETLFLCFCYSFLSEAE
jgi:hypothetical protein